MEYCETISEGRTDLMSDFVRNKDAQIFLGNRRIGKKSLLEQLELELKDQKPSDNIAFFKDDFSEKQLIDSVKRNVPNHILILNSVKLTWLPGCISKLKTEGFDIILYRGVELCHQVPGIEREF